mmetsp:Transcript_17384/g.35887  ORF Transcript_17384/g.35887 Transcript_17384/m.35887 type:complete len:223 (+) Transcript_17384:9103-9771(+)
MLLHHHPPPHVSLLPCHVLLNHLFNEILLEQKHSLALEQDTLGMKNSVLVLALEHCPVSECAVLDRLLIVLPHSERACNFGRGVEDHLAILLVLPRNFLGHALGSGGVLPEALPGGKCHSQKHRRLLRLGHRLDVPSVLSVSLPPEEDLSRGLVVEVFLGNHGFSLHVDLPYRPIHPPRRVDAGSAVVVVFLSNLLPFLHPVPVFSVQFEHPEFTGLHGTLE